FSVFTHPAIAARAIGEDLALPECPSRSLPSAQPLEADGLEWSLRMSVVWQRLAATSLRQTQQGDLFKRDLERLREDPLLASPPAQALVEVPDQPLLAFALTRAAGLIESRDGEFVAERGPSEEQPKLPTALASLFAALPT